MINQEKQRKAEKHQEYLKQWKAVAEDDPKGNELRSQLNAEYLKFDWKRELKEIAPVIVLVLWVVSLRLYLPTLSQATVDFIRETKIFEIVPVSN